MKELSECNVRRSLALLRKRWEQHGPTSPMCLSDPLDGDVTTAEFCVLFLLAQRSRRNAISNSQSAAR